MKTSIHHWGFILLKLCLIVLGFYLVTSILKDNQRDPRSLGTFLSCWFIGFFAFRIQIRMLFYTKVISIENDSITVKYIFRLKKNTYNVSEIVGFRNFTNWTRFGSYRSTHIVTSIDAVFSFNELEFFNYKSVRQAITFNKKWIDISKYHNWKTSIAINITSIVLANVLIILLLSL